MKNVVEKTVEIYLKNNPSITYAAFIVKKSTGDTVFQPVKTYAWLGPSSESLRKSGYQVLQTASPKSRDSPAQDLTAALSPTYFVSVLHYLIDSYYLHIGPLCFRRYCGIGQGNVTNPKICDLYFHDKERRFMQPYISAIKIANTNLLSLQSQLCIPLLDQDDTRTRHTVTSAISTASNVLMRSKQSAHTFSKIMRYQDDIYADMPTGSLGDHMDDIYHNVVHLVPTHEFRKGDKAKVPFPVALTYLDTRVTHDRKSGAIKLKPYDKRDQFPFLAISLDCAKSNTPLQQQHAIFGSQCLRLYNSCSTYKVFRNTIALLVAKFTKLLLKSSVISRGK